MEFGLYQHFKGKFYLALDTAKHSETLEEMVVYQSLYGNFDSWVRPKKMFEEDILTEDGIKAPRFRYVSPIEDDDSEDELLMVFDNEKDLKEAVSALENEGIDCSVQREKFDPKPAYLKSDLFLKIFVNEDDFEDAMDVFNPSTPNQP